MQKRTSAVWTIAILVLLMGAVLFRGELWKFTKGLVRSFTQEHSVRSRLRQFEATVQTRLAPHFRQANVAYPPTEIGFLALKEERVLQLYAAGPDRKLRFIRSYPIVAASGVLGPKLKEGDLQVPEGVYGIENLNPNSLYHLALRVNYPNAFDRTKAAAEHRGNLGGDIMIHGRNAPVGCLAMGDPVIEELFVLGALVGISNIEVVISPVDFRSKNRPALPKNARPWIDELDGLIRTAMLRFPLP